MKALERKRKNVWERAEGRSRERRGESGEEGTEEKAGRNEGSSEHEIDKS